MNRRFEYNGLAFEWDSEKEAKNLKRHGITFDRVAAFFRDGESVIEPDYRHSFTEERWAVLGLDSDSRLPSVCVTWRETEDGRTSYRIISAHKISGKEVARHRKRLRQRKTEASMRAGSC